MIFNQSLDEILTSYPFLRKVFQIKCIDSVVFSKIDESSSPCSSIYFSFLIVAPNYFLDGKKYRAPSKYLIENGSFQKDEVCHSHKFWPGKIESISLTQKEASNDEITRLTFYISEDYRNFHVNNSFCYLNSFNKKERRNKLERHYKSFIENNL
ncbi:MAG: hypothetical protein VXZ40_03935 [Nanoarchaeota archaeon]|nr:hypothetical protein [Nanoarchaeota archaeon]